MQAYRVRGISDRLPEIPSSRFRSWRRGAFQYADDVARVPTGFVNAYLLGTATQWVLVDSGIAGFAAFIKRAAEARFGPDTRPAAIVLTHAHFDHAGNADALALQWGVPVLAHPLELPYITGYSDYPPIDPTVGGAMAAMSRTFSSRGRELSAEIFTLSGDTIPGMPEWQWIHTPGHTAGHVSLFRRRDGLLIAGDALATMNVDSWIEQVRRTPEVCNPPAPLTTDWAAAQRSVEALAALEPRAIAAGHGLPIAGTGVAEALTRFARDFTPPPHGRYVATPALAGAEGVEWVPPAVPDPLPRQAAGAALVVAGLVGLAAVRRRAAR
jgi:glyoxylase-like metal-dependent hydrolase (beta-lactamase superfamily II)